LNVDVHVDQEAILNGTSLAQSNVKDITVAFPEGVILNPSAADGLQACSEAEVGYLPGESRPPGELPERGEDRDREDPLAAAAARASRGRCDVSRLAAELP
jgi:hypothetical protein